MQDQSDDDLHHRHDRRQHQRHPADRAGNLAGDRFRRRDGVGLGHHLGKDQHQYRHHQGRDGHAAGAQQPGEQRGGKAGRQDIDDVVAQQDRPDQALAVLGDLQRDLGAGIALVGARSQLGPAGGGQGRFGPRKEAGQHQKNQNGPAGHPEGGVEHT